MRKTAAWLTAGVGGLLLAGSVLASEWALAPPSETLIYPRVDRVLAQPDGYLLALRSQDLPWVQLDLNDQIKSQRIVPAKSQSLRPLESALINLGGREFAYPPFVDPADGDCRLQLVDTEGRITLESRFPTAFSSGCQLEVEGGVRDGGGGVWLARINTREAWRVQADGAAVALPAPDDTAQVFAIAPDPTSHQAFALYRHTQVDTLARLEGNRLLWSKSVASDGLSMHDLIGLQNGDALLAGVKPGASGNGPLSFARYATDGTLRWQRDYPELAPAVLLQLRLLSQDRIAYHALETLNGPSTIGVIDGQGNPLWSERVQGGQFVRFVDGAGGNPQFASPTFAYQLRQSTSSQVLPRDRLRLHKASGEIVVDVEVEINLAARSAVLPDGSLINASFETSPSGSRVRHWSPTGALVSERMAEELNPASGFLHLASALIGNDSLRVTLAQDNQISIDLISDTGALKWNAALQPIYNLRHGQTAFVTLSETAAPLQSNANRVCLGPIRFVEPSFLSAAAVPFALACFDRSNGAPIYQFHALPDTPSVYLTRALRLHADGRVQMIESCGPGCLAPGLNLITISADGARVSKQPLLFNGLPFTHGYAGSGDNVQPVFFADGSFAILAGQVEGPLLWARYNSAGQLLSRQTLPVEAQSFVRATALDVGHVLLHSTTEGQHRLLTIINGEPSWQRDWAGPFVIDLQPDNGYVPGFRFDAANGRVLVLEQKVQNDRVASRSVLLDAITGDERWRAQSSFPADQGSRLVRLDPNGQFALILSDRPEGSVLEVRSLADGQLIGARSLNCRGTHGCGVEAALLADDGSLRVTDRSAWLNRYQLDDSLHPARTGQPALSGTWFEPGTNGQGLLIDFSAAQGQLLGAWFTYTDEDVLDAGALRWYTLQGSLAANADRASLQIYQNQYGAFDSGPVTAAEPVGSAELQLRNCAELILNYSFDSGELAGLAATVPLTRLSPNVFDCENADGSVVAAQPTRPANSAFQPSQTGAWYSPLTAGQGLLFDIRPPSADGADRGLLLGGWFTYDIEGQEDDETAQHWFLLQGELAGATSGGAAVPIYRATGGRFDQRATGNVQRVGTATISLDSCSSGQLSYQFNDTDLAGAFRGKQGQISLIKLLGCAN